MNHNTFNLTIFFSIIISIAATVSVSGCDRGGDPGDNVRSELHKILNSEGGDEVIDESLDILLTRVTAGEDSIPGFTSVRDDIELSIKKIEGCRSLIEKSEDTLKTINDNYQKIMSADHVDPSLLIAAVNSRPKRVSIDGHAYVGATVYQSCVDKINEKEDRIDAAFKKYHQSIRILMAQGDPEIFISYALGPNDVPSGMVSALVSRMIRKDVKEMSDNSVILMANLFSKGSDRAGVAVNLGIAAVFRIESGIRILNRISSGIMKTDDYNNMIIIEEFLNDNLCFDEAFRWRFERQSRSGRSQGIMESSITPVRRTIAELSKKNLDGGKIYDIDTYKIAGQCMFSGAFK